MDGFRPLVPYVVATGFTTALLGDERTLREFIVGEHMRERISARGRTAVLLLINDSYDALSDRQLRIGVDKNEALFEKFRPYCGRPIAEIPDPFECHESYSEHFAEALRDRLHALGIYPTLVDTYHAYRRGHYAPFVRTTFENDPAIQNALAARFSDFTIKNLFRPQCPGCRCIDATRVLSIEGAVIGFDCERCGHQATREFEEVRGKLTWKLDCAARWNLYGVDLEVFSKVHVAERGTLGVSKLISAEFFGGRVPRTVTYGQVLLDRKVSYRLLRMLPPALFRKLFVTDLRRDLHLTKDFIANFCAKSDVIAGMSYVDFVRHELPRRALMDANGHRPTGGGAGGNPSELSDPRLIAPALEYARFFYGRDHAAGYPDLDVIASLDRDTARSLLDLVRFAAHLRTDAADGASDATDRIRAYLLERPHSASVYRALRRLTRQPQGPSAAGLLACLPTEYIRLLATALSLAVDETRRPESGALEPSKNS